MTNLIARDVSALKAQCVFNSLGNFHDHFVANRPALYSGLDAGHHLEAIKRLFATTAFDHVERHFFKSLVGRKSISALCATTTTANCAPFFRETRIDHLGVVKRATWTMHFWHITPNTSIEIGIFVELWNANELTSNNCIAVHPHELINEV
jgi:hypothetical protein